MEFSEFWQRLVRKNPSFGHPDAREKVELPLGEFRRLLYLAHAKGRQEQYRDNEQPGGAGQRLRDTLQIFGVKF